MTSSSEQDDNLEFRNFLPHEPLYYAPSSWHQRSRPRSPPLAPSSTASLSSEIEPLPFPHAPSSCGPLDAELEQAVYEALRRPLDPVSVSGPGDFLHDLDRRIRLFSIAGRIAAAVGFSAVVALLFVFMGPGAGDYAQTDPAPADVVPPSKAALNQPAAGTGEDAKPALCGLQTILGAPQIQPVMSHAESETLLQQFMQWREKPMAIKTP
jgi:hypothetical protein